MRKLTFPRLERSRRESTGRIQGLDNIKIHGSEKLKISKFDEAESAE